MLWAKTFRAAGKINHYHVLAMVTLCVCLSHTQSELILADSLLLCLQPQEELLQLSSSTCNLGELLPSEPEGALDAFSQLPSQALNLRQSAALHLKKIL